MQIFIHKNGQQVGPFEEVQALEMMEKGEFSADDFIFREGDKEWSKIGKFYEIIKPQIVKLTIKTGLIIELGLPPSEYQPTESVYLKVPSETAESFKNDYLEKFYKIYYGKTWRSGNSDGSLYVVLDEKIEFIDEDIAGITGKTYLATFDSIEPVGNDIFERAKFFVRNIPEKQSGEIKTESLVEEIAAKEIVKNIESRTIKEEVFAEKEIEINQILREIAEGNADIDLLRKVSEYNRFALILLHRYGFIAKDLEKQPLDLVQRNQNFEDFRYLNVFTIEKYWLEYTTAQCEPDYYSHIFVSGKEIAEKIIANQLSGVCFNVLTSDELIFDQSFAEKISNI